MSIYLESPNVTSLDAARQAFEHWRHTRTRRGSTPAVLRVQAVSLIGEHRRAHICSALRINDQALRQWEKEITDPDATQHNENQSDEAAQHQGIFIELPTDNASASVSELAMDGRSRMTAIHIDLPNGAVIRTDQHFTLEQLVQAACVSMEPGT